VPAAPPIKYVLGYRTLTLNPNPTTDPNPNPYPKINQKTKTKRHRNKIQHSYFPRDGGWFIKGL